MAKRPCVIRAENAFMEHIGRDLTDEEEVKEVKSAKWNETGNKGHTGKTLNALNH